MFAPTMARPKWEGKPTSQTLDFKTITLSNLAANLYIPFSLFTGRDFSPLNITPRSMPRIPCFWCLHQTFTAIFIQQYDTQTWRPSDAPQVLEFLSAVLNVVRNHLFSNPDGPIPNGQFLVEEYGAKWFVVNDNNHQVTWGVMGSAVEALTNFFGVVWVWPCRFYNLGRDEFGRTWIVAAGWSLRSAEYRCEVLLIVIVKNGMLMTLGESV